MPIRSYLEGTSHTQVLNGVTNLYSVGNSVGTYQSISALNNAGSWKPGVFRANAVVIKKIASICLPGSMVGVDKYLANRGELQGHVHSSLTTALGWTPLSGNLDWCTQWDQVAAAASLQNALAKMNSAELDLGMMLGELRETISGLAKPLSALRDYIRLWNKLKQFGKSPRMTDRLNMLTGSWLEWRYGIVPLISDISAIIEHVKAQSVLLDGKLLRKRSKVVIPARNLKFSGSTYPGYYQITGTVSVEVKAKYVSSVFYTLTRPLSFGETYGLTLGSLPSIAWELAPLSFVWDWFFGVGNWLQSCNTSEARSFCGSTTSQKSTVVVRTTIDNAKFYGVVKSSFGGGSHITTFEKLDRRINQAVAISPQYNRAALSVKRQVDALSLIWQRLPKLRR